MGRGGDGGRLHLQRLHCPAGQQFRQLGHRRPLAGLLGQTPPHRLAQRAVDPGQVRIFLGDVDQVRWGSAVRERFGAWSANEQEDP